jgi:hypothetical protein
MNDDESMDDEERKMVENFENKRIKIGSGKNYEDIIRKDVT